MNAFGGRQRRRDLLRAVVVCSLGALCAAGGVRAAAGPAAPAVRPVVLPRDHGAHPGFGVEWWYTAGTIAHAHEPYFWFATAWSEPAGVVGRVNLVDLRTGRTVLAHEYASAAVPTAGQRHVDVNGFRLSWQPRGRLGHWSVGAPVPGGALTLQLTPQRPYMLQGRHGIIQQGPGGLAAYYSEPQLAARGTLRRGHRRLPLAGVGWLDHQWGNFTTTLGALRWNWFACRMSDGRDLMLYQFLNTRNRPSGYRSGTVLAPRNTIHHLRRFRVSPLRPSFRPPRAKESYPLRWRLRVPSQHLDITLRSRTRNAFITNSLVPNFWEGPATITSGGAGSCIVESSRESVAQ